MLDTEGADYFEKLSKRQLLNWEKYSQLSNPNSALCIALNKLNSYSSEAKIFLSTYMSVMGFLPLVMVLI
jgi:hypothetical protein